MSDEELELWLSELLAEGEEDDERSVKELVDDLLERDDNDALEQALDANRELRDDNFVTPEALLVFTEATGELEEVELWDLPLRYPLVRPGQRWSYSDLGEVVAAKAALYRQSKVANELAEEDPTATPECGTVVLVVTEPDRPLRWCVVKARVLAERAS